MIEAVTELRRRCPGVPIYGIIDRDLAAAEALDSDFIGKGILRTPRCTLENYLLESECWAKVFSFIFSRQGAAPDSWDAPIQVRGYIEHAFQECLPLSAYNHVIQYGNHRYTQQARQTPEAARSYRDHPDALAGGGPAVKLRSWGQQLGAAEDFGDLFERELQALERDPARWPQDVSGKPVLQSLHRRFPRLPGAGQFSLSHYLNLYVRECPFPPEDIAALINRIVEHARWSRRE